LGALPPARPRRFPCAADVEPEDYYTYSMAVTPGFEYLRFLRPANVRRGVTSSSARWKPRPPRLRGGQGVSILSRWAMRAEIEDGRLVPLRAYRARRQDRLTALLRRSDGAGSAPHATALRARGLPREGALPPAQVELCGKFTKIIPI
jgi:LysR family transcriptional regulator for metE and metH